MGRYATKQMKKVLTYITGIRHPSTVDDYEAYWETILDAWESWIAQTERGLCLISCVTNQLPKSKNTRRKLKKFPVILTVIDDPPPEGGNSRKGTFYDKGGKLAIAALAARGESTWVMVADCDDHVSRNLVPWLRDNGKAGTGYQLTHGYTYYAHNGRLFYQDRFHRRCGTCNIFDAEILLDHIPEITTIEGFSQRGDDATQNLLARHNHANKSWKKWEGRILTGIKERLATYQLEHGSNVSLNRTPGFVRGKRRKMERLRGAELALTKEFIEEFRIKATPAHVGQVISGARGAGTHLAALIATGRLWCRRCSRCERCKRLARKMDKNGPQWCRDNADVIVAAMLRNGRATRVPAASVLAHKFLKMAIKRAEAEESAAG